MFVAFEVVTGLALAAMIASLVLVLRLRKIGRGGKVGRVINTLVVFIALFLVAYVLAPAFPFIPPSIVTLLVSLVFLFGALFVVIVLWLIERLVKQVFDELGG